MTARAAPFVIPQSRDVRDNRPDTSGHVPIVHYNVPMFMPLATERGWGPDNPVVDAGVRLTANAARYFNPVATQPSRVPGVPFPTGLMNLASIIIPGRPGTEYGMPGGPTAQQQGLLSAIHDSTYSVPITNRISSLTGEPETYPTVSAPFNLKPKAVKNLASHVGTPAASHVLSRNPFSQFSKAYVAKNPFDEIYGSRNNPLTELGLRTEDHLPPKAMGVGKNDIPAPASENEVAKFLIDYLKQSLGDNGFRSDGTRGQ